MDDYDSKAFYDNQEMVLSIIAMVYARFCGNGAEGEAGLGGTLLGWLPG